MVFECFHEYSFSLPPTIPTNLIHPLITPVEQPSLWKYVLFQCDYHDYYYYYHYHQ